MLILVLILIWVSYKKEINECLAVCTSIYEVVPPNQSFKSCRRNPLCNESGPKGSIIKAD